MTGQEFVCPVCGREYEPEYENKEDAPPRSIGREQHQTGICSEDCWGEFVPLPDGGTVMLERGEFAEDSEQEPDRRDKVVVVERPGTVAREHYVEGADATVFLLNQQYDYSPEEPVVDVAYVGALDAADEEWREYDTQTLPWVCKELGVSTYSFPQSRLERIADERGGA